MSADDITTSMGIKPFPTLRSCPADFDNYCTSSSPDASCITPNGFTIRCNRGVLGNNMSDEKQDPNSVTLLGCLDSCKNTDGCVAVAFMKDEGTAQGLCSLKDTVYAGVVDKAFIGEQSSGTTLIECTVNVFRCLRQRRRGWPACCRMIA